jgi:hypothetical protein
MHQHAAIKQANLMKIFVHLISLTGQTNPNVGVAGRPSFAASLKELGLSAVGAAAFRQPKPLGVRRVSLCEKDEELLSKELGRGGRIICFCT